LLVVPHNLNTLSIIELKTALNTQFPDVPLYEVKKGQEFDASQLKTKPGIVILNMSGILCEIYSKFAFAYVGGGFERSIHSVLEPFLSGCEVFTGPKINRSTEYDFIKNVASDEIHLLKNSESFYNLSVNTNSCDRNQLSKNAETLMESIIKEIELC
jgi:3-deoxy-D-manno-octulosonic-acid transferase